MSGRRRPNKPLPELIGKELERFWAQIEVGPKDECWPWIGCLVNGYGQFKLAYQNYKAHRLAYMIHTSFDPGLLIVCHICDKPSCCNPSHLFLGTHDDNSKDMVRKGRSVRHLGEDHGQSKLTEAEVLEIRERVGTCAEVGAEYGISAAMVCLIGNQKNWTHL